MNRMGWQVAAEYTAAPEAHIAAGMLEEHGIDVIVDSPTMGTLYGAGSTWAPVLLYVPESEAERAAALLAEHGDLG